MLARRNQVWVLDAVAAGASGSEIMTRRALGGNSGAGMSAEDLLADFGSLPSSATALVYEQVYRQLRHALVANDIEQGAHMVEADLAERLGASRTAVRDALRRLEADGLVLRTSRGGLEAATLSGGNLDGVFQVRAELDRLAARLAGEQATPAAWAALRAKAVALGPIVEEFGIASYELGEAHEAIHAEIYAIAFTPFVANMLGDRLLGLGRVAGQISYAEDRADEPIVEQHLVLLDALAGGDPEAAVRAADEHVQQAWADARASFDRPATPDGPGPT
jgi:DNA-binding GntR family transcriptional regulator